MVWLCVVRTRPAVATSGADSATPPPPPWGLSPWVSPSACWSRRPGLRGGGRPGPVSAAVTGFMVNFRHARSGGAERYASADHPGLRPGALGGQRDRGRPGGSRGPAARAGHGLCNDRPLRRAYLRCVLRRPRLVPPRCGGGLLGRRSLVSGPAPHGCAHRVFRLRACAALFTAAG